MPNLQHYQALFQKHAAAEQKPLQNTIDNHEVANEEHDKNIKDSRETLMGLFTHAALSSKEQTKTVKKLLKPKGDVDTSNPLLKIAQMVLGRLPENLGFLKTASAAYRQVAGASFLDEVEKIANIANLGDFAHAAKAKAPKKVEKKVMTPAVHTGDSDYA